MDILYCDQAFKFRCPHPWATREPMADPDVRHCDWCEREVFKCRDRDEAIEHAVAGHWVAITQTADNVVCLLGDLDPETLLKR